MRVAGLAILAIMAFVGCGGEEGGGESTAVESVEEQGVPDELAPRRAKTTVDALAVATEGDLPACERNGALAYVIASKTFKVCDGRDWLAIDIKGEKGDVGAVGPQGEAGPAGPAGATTVVEVAPLMDNQFYDLITGLTWLHVGNGSYGSGSCAGEYRRPTPYEFSVAVEHGLIGYFQANGYAITSYWRPYEEAYNAGSTAPYISPAGDGFTSKASAFGRVCVK